MSAGIVLRSAVYALFQLLFTPVYAIVSILTFPLPLLGRYRVISLWARLMVKAAEAICGIRYRVIGAEHIPRAPCIILSNHQSSWETFFYQVIFPPQVWVLKRELLWIPFFGWGLAMLAPIAIDRSSRTRALKQTLDQGRDRLQRGFCIVIFPEGTRVGPDEDRPYQSGGAWLATKTGARIVPVAHDAGRCWPRNAWVKRPGTITVSIGEAIDPRGLTADEVNGRAERWIKSEQRRIAGHEYA
jgi:1-acyl-sn-glycerol-3-phosphate acyltransferase